MKKVYLATEEIKNCSECPLSETSSRKEPGEWTLAKQKAPEPDTEYWCAIRLKYTRFDYKTMGSLEVEEGIVEDFLGTKEDGQWKYPSLDCCLCGYAGLDVLNELFHYSEEIEKAMYYSSNCYYARFIETVTKKKQYINDLEVEILAYHKMPEDFEEWIKGRD